MSKIFGFDYDVFDLESKTGDCLWALYVPSTGSTPSWSVIERVGWDSREKWVFHKMLRYSIGNIVFAHGQTRIGLYILDFGGEKIECVRIIRALTDMSLKEALALILPISPGCDPCSKEGAKVGDFPVEIAVDAMRLFEMYGITVMLKATK